LQAAHAERHPLERASATSAAFAILYAIDPGNRCGQCAVCADANRRRWV